MRNAILASLFLIASLAGAGQTADAPPNLAKSAKITASTFFSDIYKPELAVTGGNVPPGGEGGEWAMKAATSGWFEMNWEQPVEAAQIIYACRTHSPILECFKGYAVYANGQDKPIATGTFERRYGPQKIDFPKQPVTKLRIEFLSSYPESPNPGASQISVHAMALTDAQLAQMGMPPGEKGEKSLALRKDLLDGKFGFKQIFLVKRKPLDLSHVYVYHVEGYRPGGGLYLFTPDEKQGELKCIFDAGEGMITTADLSYDGKEIVFALRRGGHVASNPVAHIEDISQYPEESSNYQVLRINIDGSGLTQLTHGPCNNLDPCWLPDGGIAFISDRKPAYAYCYVVTSPVLYRMERDGTKQKRLSANYLMDFTPGVLNNGRIIYTRWEYVDRPAIPIQSLWTINPDGTNLAGYYGNRVLSPATFMHARPLPNSNSVLCTLTSHNGPCRGAIGMIDPSLGTNSQAAIRNLTPEVNIGKVDKGDGNSIRGPYENPFPIDDQHFLVSKAGTVQLRDFDANAASLLVPEGGMGFYSPQPVWKRTPPRVIGGGIIDNTVELPQDGSVSGKWASLYMQDVYNGLEPHVKRGEVKQIAIVQEMEKSTHTPQNNKNPDKPGMRNIAVFGFQFPLVSCGATYAPKKVWGFADVKPDGSAAFRVPSEVPIYFLALDAEGRAVQRMRSFTHLMPGEIQGCVGCHSDRNTVTPSMDKPRNVTPQELKKPAWGVKGFSYREVVQGVFDKHCISCHNERDEQGKVDLTGDMTDFFNVSYDILCRTGTQGVKRWLDHGSPLGAGRGDKVRGMSPWVEWIWTINGAEENILEIAPRRWGSPASKLTEIIRSGHPDKDGKARCNVPDEDRRRVYLWMDLNIPYYGTSSSNHKEQLGSRRMLPLDLDKTLSEVAERRCAECHKDGIPRKFYTRVMNPEKNNFLLAPLAKSAGGLEKCGKAVFADTKDADYQKIIKTFEPIHALLKERPRPDMEDYVPICKP
ncbi:MAG TPA: hypothetical protein VGP72_10880 [Planctomycetota bacterium]|jgi:hypothetical protein